MSNENKAENNNLYSLIPLDDFKLILNIDDRDERLARFCLVTGTLTIEQYYKQKFLRKKYFEKTEFTGSLFLQLREYPVTSILAVYSFGNGEILEPEFYHAVPELGTDIDLQFALSFLQALQRYKSLTTIRTVYFAGYRMGSVPADLASACLELASWIFNRYRGKRIGMTGNINGAGKEGEHFEMSMPEQVRLLLEPYKRKVI